ncbi:cupin domain-containing protein [Microbacterium sp. A1-JK]|uniref:cupin domain-containing protein n=1 Tax=Microbacterium sp. A1-JK TaxID=3177516 RepID=UPI00388610F3
MLSGRLRLVIGEQDVTLGTGEIEKFDTRIPHRLATIRPGPASVLSIFSKAGSAFDCR